MSKLVRDKIPEIIFKQTGKEPKQEILKDDAVYFDALHKKLLEELNEFIVACAENSNKEEAENSGKKEMEELADMLEVIDAICEFKKYDKNLIQDYKLAKKDERGGFEKRILLLI